MDERLKQSIESARAASSFIKKRAALEEEHAYSIRKLLRNTTTETAAADARGGDVTMSDER